MTARANASHIGSSLSTADLLAVLFARHLRFDPQRPDWPERDRFILSKGHGCAALYAVLAEAGYFAAERLETFYQDGSPLVGHANPQVTRSIYLHLRADRKAEAAAKLDYLWVGTAT